MEFVDWLVSQFSQRSNQFLLLSNARAPSHIQNSVRSFLRASTQAEESDHILSSGAER
jgi:hypothetical protein